MHASPVKENFAILENEKMTKQISEWVVTYTWAANIPGVKHICCMLFMFLLHSQGVV